MIPYAICFFGYVIKIRLFSVGFVRFDLEKKIQSTVYFTILSFDLFVTIIVTSPMAIWCWQILGIIILFFLPRWLETLLESELQKIVGIFLDHTILSIQAGLSLRSAVKESAQRFHGWKRYELLKASSSLIIASNKSQLQSAVLQQLFDEIRWIDESRNKTLEQFKSLRWHYKVYEDFRRKSGQISQQSRIQAVVMTLLYVALFIFNAIEFGFSGHQGLILFSVALFSTGLILVFTLGRRMKWKI
jgi:hypothetical protein